MNRNNLRKIHAAAGAGAFLFIASFWSSTVFSELFGSHETVAAVKQTIVYALFGLIACMAIAGATGMKMGGKSKHAAIAAKRRRMPFIAAYGFAMLFNAVSLEVSSTYTFCGWPEFKPKSPE